MKTIVKRPRVPVHGVLLLDKPVGYSSNDALIQVKRLLSAQKAGHTGTLDPFATGLLPLCFGEATKFAQDLLEADKTYETTVRLGITTETGDTEGTVTARTEVRVSRTQIEAVLTQFRGPIQQIPPMYSALKRDGKPLYEYARAGITLERSARPVTIYELELLDYQAPDIRLRVRCSKGTYVRVLGTDIGATLGCGAHLQALRRIQLGTLDVANAVTLDQFRAWTEAQRHNALGSVDALLSSFTALYLAPDLAQRFCHGQRLALDATDFEFPPEACVVRVYDKISQRLLGTANWQPYGVLAPQRLMMFESISII
ncbi:MAG: tRNA pseudouridine(55) synthase TruB [Herbaspirillum sp.]